MRIYKISNQITIQEAQDIYDAGYDAKQNYVEGKKVILSPDLRNSPKGRLFIMGWNAWKNNKKQLTQEDIDNITSMPSDDESLSFA